MKCWPDMSTSSGRPPGGCGGGWRPCRLRVAGRVEPLQLIACRNSYAISAHSEDCSCENIGRVRFHHEVILDFKFIALVFLKLKFRIQNVATHSIIWILNVGKDHLNMQNFKNYIDWNEIKTHQFIKIDCDFKFSSHNNKCSKLWFVDKF